MNRAAKLASSDIFARMDADDIAFPDEYRKNMMCYNG
jgi:glycosyltransferase involved in cell wall biosynthesis